jgi:competence CoiA-like predicted nuclease
MENNNSGNQVKLPFGLRDGELVHISTVQSGLACKCSCAACDAILIARKGIKNAHHFAHYKAEE